MRHVVFGVPARNEGGTIGELAERLEQGASLLGEIATCELVLGYQTSTDATLEQWDARRARVPRSVVFCPPGVRGKGQNIKRLIRHARNSGADLLLVDGDLRDYQPVNAARFVAAAHDGGVDLVLPLWCRPWGQANTTNYLASPLVHAVWGARVRQPLAGQMFLSSRFLDDLDLDRLPDDYGIDFAITVAALNSPRSIGQVVLPRLVHDAREGNSERIMMEVATTALAAVATTGRPAAGVTPRTDVRWPDRYWERLEWPEPTPAATDFNAIIATGTVAPGTNEDMADWWCRHLGAAIRACRAGADPAHLAEQLRIPFFVHAEHQRRRAQPDLATAEAYVATLGDRLAAQIA